MKVVDELFTPGCPQCAVKHLSAALYHAALHGADRLRPSDPPQRLVPAEATVLLARAYINLGEVLIGYKSHLWFAVGLLQHAEEVAQRDCVPFVAETARHARLMLTAGGLSPLQGVMQHIGFDGNLGHLEMACAHFDEAVRELPAFASEMRMDDLIGSIERIREEFFNFPPSMVPGDEETTKIEKEPDMATTKKTAPKGAKCAAKGGKTATKTCAKCAEKGGKTATKATTKTATKATTNATTKTATKGAAKGKK
jgi:hypothetical protein